MWSFIYGVDVDVFVFGYLVEEVEVRVAMNRGFRVGRV